MFNLFHKHRVWHSPLLATLFTLAFSCQSFGADSTPISSSPVIQRGPVGRVEKMAFSPNGEHLAVGSAGMVQIWNRQSGEVEQNLELPGTPTSIAWSPDGSRLASGGLTLETGYWRGFILIHEARSGRPLQNWRTGYAAIKGLVWSADGNRLASASGGDFENRAKQAAARLWTPHGELITTLATYISDSASLTLSPDKQTLTLDISGETNFRSALQFFDFATGKPLAQPYKPQASKPSVTPAPLPNTQGETLLNFTLSPDSRWLATSTSSGSERKNDPAFRLWHLEEKAHRWKLARQVAFHRAFPLAVAATSDTLAVSTYSDVVSLWNLREAKSPLLVPHQHYESAIALSPDGKHLASSFLWDLTTLKPRQGLRLKNPGLFGKLAFSPDGNTLIDSNGLVNVKTGQRKLMKIVTEASEYELGRAQSVSFSGDGKILATVDSSRSSDQLHLWNGKTGQFLRQIDLLEALKGLTRFQCVAFAPHSDVLAVSGVVETELSRGELFLGLIDSKSGRIIRRFSTDAKDAYGITDLKFSSDGKTLVTTGIVFRSYGSPTPEQEKQIIRTNSLTTPERTVRVWDVEQGKLRHTLPALDNSPMPLGFISNEICAVVSSGRVEFWNIAQPRLLVQLAILSIKPSKEGLDMEWMASTPEGIYDFSKGAATYLRWNVQGTLQTKPSSNVLRQPGLLQNVLRQAQ